MKYMTDYKEMRPFLHDLRMRLRDTDADGALVVAMAMDYIESANEDLCILMKCDDADDQFAQAYWDTLRELTGDQEPECAGLDVGQQQARKLMQELRQLRSR